MLQHVRPRAVTAAGFFMPEALTIDWQTAELDRRVAAASALPLVRACGLHKTPGLRILDTTAGLGRDAVVLARLGAQVHMLERVQDVHHALVRALESSPPELQAQLSLSACDARKFLLTVTPEQYDVALIDPMFVGESHSAKAKRDVQALRTLAGGDPDAADLAAAAWQAPIARLVIKRSPRAPALLAHKPGFVLRGNRARFDVYLRPEHTET